MWPMVTHYCTACSYSTPVQYHPGVFDGPIYCNHCGSASSGVTVRTQQELARLRTSELQAQDELAGLFAKSMTFDANPTPPPELNKQPLLPAGDSKRVYASMHYIPNSVQQQQHSTPQTSPSPEQQNRPLSDDEIAEMLIRNSIDPHSLFPTQVALFRGAQPEQQLRLLELWRISPPNQADYDNKREQSIWIESTLQQEEQVARARYERALMLSQGVGSPNVVQSQMQEGVQIERPSTAPQVRSRPVTSHLAAAEPYMMSGYEMLAAREYERDLRAENSILTETRKYNQAIDPAYNVPESWDKDVQDMENRYGAFEAMRRGGDGRGFNGNGEYVGEALNALDSEMVM